MTQPVSQANSVEVQNLDLSFGALEVLKGLNLEIPQGEFLVLLGSSGCGKSTLLNCIAGLLEVSGGKIFIQGKNVTWAEPSERGIGMVFQSYALYPQMTVKGNLSFGLKNQRMPKAEIEQRVARAAEILQIEPLLNRKPGALSGGQRQRVAIGRALVRDVDVFLFDEPLSNLDANLRTDLRVELKRLHQRLGNTMIYVTHDQIEALTLADRIAIMKDGLIQQIDSPKGIYNTPCNRFVAGFIGSPSMNFVKGVLVSQEGQWVFEAQGLSVPLAGYDFIQTPSNNLPVELGIRPEHIAIAGNAMDQPVQLSLTVDLVEPMGADTVIWSELAGAPFTIRADSDVAIDTTSTLTAGFNPSRASIFNSETGLRV